MDANKVTSKGQVTIPRPIRQKMGIRQGSKVKFLVVGNRVELRVVNPAVEIDGGGFGMLKSRRKAMPPEFDVASLLIGKRK